MTKEFNKIAEYQIPRLKLTARLC